MVAWSEVGAGDFIDLDGDQVEVINRRAVGDRLHIKVAYYLFAAEADVDPADKVERVAEWPKPPGRRPVIANADSPADGWSKVPKLGTERWTA